MTRLRYLTAGESHGPQLTAIVEGCPSRLPLRSDDIDRDLARRQLGYGRGDRQAIERDRVRIVSGVRYGRTTGAPVTFVIENRDHANWGEKLAVDEPAVRAEALRAPRPGHADLGGALVYGVDDLRDVIERASARETAARVAVGALARRLLAEIGCRVASHVVAIGGVRSTVTFGEGVTIDEILRAEDDAVRCLDPEASLAMRAAIDDARERGDTLGGVVEVVAVGYPPGVGSYAQADRRLGGRLAAAVMSINAIKGVEVGLGFAAATTPGSAFQDEILYSGERGYYRQTNRAGGIEGGISTGAPIVVRAAMKPISTLMKPLRTVELGTHRAVEAHVERSDVCAVPAAGVVAEAAVAFALAAAALERFGGESLAELVAAVDACRERARTL
jgi:chorismate synthase